MLEEKHKIMENFLKFPKQLKESNIKFTNARIQETCSEFMCDKTTSPLALAGYAVYYGIDIYIVDKIKHTYLKFLSGNNKDESEKQKAICWIYKDDTSMKYTKYILKIENENNDNNETFYNTHCCLEQFDKPLLGISQYKLQDIENFEKILGIPVNSEKSNKQQRYAAIAAHMAWTW
jgi:hypothetical protein